MAWAGWSKSVRDVTTGKSHQAGKRNVLAQWTADALTVPNMTHCNSTAACAGAVDFRKNGSSRIGIESMGRSTGGRSKTGSGDADIWRLLFNGLVG
jgi:hypothetical protein